MSYIDIQLSRYPALTGCEETIRAAFDLWRCCFEGGGKLLVCGNGGSAADCEHIVGELMKGFVKKRVVPPSMRQSLMDYGDGAYLADHLQQALPAISLVSHSGVSTAFVNDVAADMVFAQQVYGYGKPGDLLFALSTSGNSTNVVQAVKVARSIGMSTMAISGFSGGKLKSLCDCCICLPETETYKVQELTLPVYHALCADIESYFFE